MFMSSSVIIMSISACKHKLVCHLQGTPIIYTVTMPKLWQLHCAYACAVRHMRLHPIEALCGICMRCTNGLSEQHRNVRTMGVQLQLEGWFIGVHVCLCVCLRSHSICIYSIGHKKVPVPSQFYDRWTIVERSLNDRETVHVRSAYDRTVVFVYAHADIIFRIHSRPKHEKV